MSNTATRIAFDLTSPSNFSIEFSEAHGDHVHYMGDYVTGTGWKYCNRCKCFVSTKCDHRRVMCRDRKTAVGGGDG